MIDAISLFLHEFELVLSDLSEVSFDVLSVRINNKLYHLKLRKNRLHNIKWL